jgi:hypothetical protein
MALYISSRLILHWCTLNLFVKEEPSLHASSPDLALSLALSGNGSRNNEEDDEEGEDEACFEDDHLGLKLKYTPPPGSSKRPYHAWSLTPSHGTPKNASEFCYYIA